MPNLNSSFKEILEDLEKNIKDKEDLEYTKVQLFNLYNLFFEEISKLEELANSRVSEIARAQASIEEKVEEIAKGLRSIEQDIYSDEDEDYEFTIVCPYCDKEFSVDVDEMSEDIICPECNNSIELDWGHECDCGGECDDECDCGCDTCGHHMDDTEDDM